MRPLADEIRPQTFDDVAGQKHLLGEGALLRRLIENGTDTNLIFYGPSGTGKTTVARLLAGLYKAIGILPKGQLIEVDRSGLVAGFVGQTALKTQEVIQKAIGGVLFIDEAYALVNQDNGNDFGREAVEVLLKNMEDHRKDLVVIAAGYSQLMEKFIHSNPGRESRFNKYFYFEDYDGGQLFTIFQSMCSKNGYVLTPEGESLARRELMAHTGASAETLRRLADQGLLAADGLIDGLEIVLDVHTELTFGKVAQVAHTGLDLVLPAQIFSDGFRLGRRLDDHQMLFCHECYSSSSVTVKEKCLPLPCST